MRVPRPMGEEAAELLGFDPGFASFGWAHVRLLRTSEMELLGVGVVRTQKDAAKHEVFAAGDNFNRAKEIAAVLNRMVVSGRVRAFCAESMSFPRSASVAAKMAMSWGLIAMLAEQRKMPLVASSPQKIKQSVAGAKSASKEDIQEALIKRFPTLSAMLAPITKSKHEHACDALAAIVTASGSDVVNALWRR